MPASPDTPLFRNDPDPTREQFNLSVSEGANKSLTFRVRDYGEDEYADIRSYDTVELRSRFRMSTLQRPAIEVTKVEADWQNGLITIPFAPSTITGVPGSMAIMVVGLSNSGNDVEVLGRGLLEIMPAPGVETPQP